MCEYCGCQEVPEIAELTAEHDRIREVGRALSAAAAADDLPAARLAADQVLALLDPHTAVEERGLVPAMAGEFGEHVHQLLEEHSSIHGALREVRDAAVPAPGWQARVGDALARLHEHILKEQDGLFPAALASLSVSYWDAVAAARAAVTARSG
jgi:hemerythrin-like domain-containing protein